MQRGETGRPTMSDESSADPRFDALFDRFDGFHDWVLDEVRVFASEEGMLAAEATNLHYDAEVILCDPYKRSETLRVRLQLSNVNSAAVSGLSNLGSELPGLRVRRTRTGIELSSTEGDSLRVEAGSFTLRTG